MAAEVSTARIEELLREENPQARLIDLQIYADALRTYREATENIRENGAICAHPRTGTPIENPYLSVQAKASGILARLRGIQCDRVMEELGDDESSDDD